MCMCTCICVCVWICVYIYGYCVSVCIYVDMYIYMYIYVYVCIRIYIYINYSMSHDHQDGVCLQRQSIAEKSSENIFSHKFLSVFKLHHDYSISEATENHFIRRDQKEYFK